MRLRKFNEHFDLQQEVPHENSDKGFDSKMQVTFHVPDFIIDICREFDIPDDQIPDAFHSYVEGAMNDYISSGQDCPIVKIAKRDFKKWCEQNT